MKFFEVFNHLLQLQLTRTHTSEFVVATCAQDDPSLVFFDNYGRHSWR